MKQDGRVLFIHDEFFQLYLGHINANKWKNIRMHAYVEDSLARKGLLP